MAATLPLEWGGVRLCFLGDRPYEGSGDFCPEGHPTFRLRVRLPLPQRSGYLSTKGLAIVQEVVKALYTRNFAECESRTDI